MERYSYKEFIGLVIRIGVTGDHVTSLVRVDKAGEDDPTPLSERAFAELSEYFAGKRKNFDLPIACEGTEFQKKVWKALLDIPYGETRSYREIARAVESPKSYRAVGGANHLNKICILIPCHRVVNADGSLGGYGGGLDMKEILLDLERKYKDA